jgi:uncharacterized membrane protein YidH (DUF202 family)
VEIVLYFADGQRAGERPTFLAWLRTGIALFGLGFVVAKVALIVQPDSTRLENKDFYSTVGVLIVLSGAALIVAGQVQHAHVWHLLGRHGDAERPRWPLAITPHRARGVARALRADHRVDVGAHDGHSRS